MKRIIIVALLAGFIATANAGFEEGMAAYNAKNYAQAVNEWHPLAEQGDAGSQTNLGLMYMNGRGVPQDYDQALSWFRKSAEQGITVAQFNLGLMYANGRGVQQDWVVGYALLNLAAAELNSAIENRDFAISKMTPTQIKAGQQLTREIAKPNNLTKAIAAYLKSKK